METYRTIISQIIRIGVTLMSLTPCITKHKGSKLTIAGFPTKVENANRKSDMYDDYPSWSAFIDRPKSKYTDDDFDKLQVCVSILLYYFIGLFFHPCEFLFCLMT